MCRRISRSLRDDPDTATSRLRDHRRQRRRQADAWAGGGAQQVVAKEYEPLFAQIFDRVLGPTSQLRGESADAPINGKPEAWYRQSFANHAGGTSQLKRMVLATRGLGLPR